jgi:hypothetical protein
VKALTVLYVVFLAGSFTGCAAWARIAWMRHRDQA